MQYLYQEEIEAGLRSALGPLCLPRNAGAAADYVLPSMRRAFRAVTEPKDLENVGLREFRQLLTYFKWYFFEAFGQPTPTRTLSPRRSRSPRASKRSPRDGATKASPRGSVKLPQITPRGKAQPAERGGPIPYTRGVGGVE